MKPKKKWPSVSIPDDFPIKRLPPKEPKPQKITRRCKYQKQTMDTAAIEAHLDNLADSQKKN
jgi:hypothetical protein